jgi:hypothetical protein
MDGSAEGYVRLALALGEHDPDYVDAWHGPPAWRDEARAAKLPLDEIARRAEVELAAVPPAPAGADEVGRLRPAYLRAQLSSLRARARMLQGERLSFADEARALYGAAPPPRPDAEFRAVVDALDRALPGSGPVAARLEAFRARQSVPAHRLRAVIDLSVAACRARTKAHLALPPGERFDVELVSGKPWAAYNWYQGGDRSLIQFNTDPPPWTPIHVLSTACHEGYPGHHVLNVLQEEELLRRRGWIEFAIQPLYSATTLLAEGSANYGFDLAFPEAERVAFAREALWPAAGLDPADAGRALEVERIARGLRHAGAEAGRRMIDEGLSPEATAAWLEANALQPPERARRSVAFLQRYRAYVVSYGFGEDLVRAWVERTGGPEPAGRWRALGALLAAPHVGQDLL